MNEKTSQMMNIESLKGTLKPFLRPYLESQGVEIVEGKNFSCLNPMHEDKHPSCGFIRDSNQESFHCFSCLVSGDIFTAAGFLEDRPLVGKAFITDNLYYLAEKFGLETPDVELTDDEHYDLQTFRAYRDAARTLLELTNSDIVGAKLADYGWSPDVCRRLGVGGLSSFEEYLELMTKSFGYTKKFLRDVDLDNKFIFSPDCLIFTIKDENGNPVAFAARNLKYEEELSHFENQRKKIVKEKGEDATELKKLRQPRKYFNSTQGEGETNVRNRIYQKSKRLFGFHEARKYVPPLFVFEGYADCVTVVNAGILNSVAIGSTSFTKQHLDLVLNCGIKHIVFVLDADKAGDLGTERFVNLLDESLGNRVGLRVEIIVLPEGSDDPDSFIRKEGVEAFRELSREDVFTWRLGKALRDGEDPHTLVDRIIPLIVNESSRVVRYRMAQNLSGRINIPIDVIWGEVTRQVDSDSAQLEEQKTAEALRLADQIRRNPKQAQAIVKSYETTIEIIDRGVSAFDPEVLKRNIDIVFDKFEKNDNKMDLRTNWPIFDENLGGIPNGEVFISVPGKPNHGKSNLLANLAWRLVEYNEDVVVIYHTVDDANEWFVPRLLGSRFNINSEYFRRAGWYSHERPGFQEQFSMARGWLDDAITSERLLISDSSGVPASLPALENWIKNVRQRHPDRKLVVFGDNFALYNLPGHDDGERKVRMSSMFIKRMANEHHCSIIMTQEVTKEYLRPGLRPRLASIKGSSGIAFDANLNIGVYNDLKDKGDQADLYWNDPDERVRDIGPNGEEQWVPRQKPIIELVFDKSKICSFDGSIFFRFHPLTGRYDECVAEEQAQMRLQLVGTNTRQAPQPAHSGSW